MVTYAGDDRGDDRGDIGEMIGAMWGRCKGAVAEMHLGEADVAARGELGELGAALELPLGGVRVRVRVRVRVKG